MKVGDYVRTNHRREKVIRKVIAINECHDGDHRIIFDKPTKYEYFVEDENYYTFSADKIDLIEVGDYVNGHEVLNVLDFNDNSKMLSLEKIYDSKITNEDIKSIVTKEQFEAMQYKVGE